jgi:hypothetical protein
VYFLQWRRTFTFLKCPPIWQLEAYFLLPYFAISKIKNPLKYTHFQWVSLNINMCWRRRGDSNPRILADQRFSRPPRSTTLPPLLWDCKNIKKSNITKRNIRDFRNKEIITNKVQRTAISNAWFFNILFIFLAFDRSLLHFIMLII